MNDLDSTAAAAAHADVAVDARRRQDDSTEVYRHRWSPAAGVRTRPRGVYLLHGTGEHAARYERLAQRLTAAGWRVGAHDHPGHGRSGGPRGRLPVDGALATRAAIECARFANETGAVPFLFGHSLGGVVACELVLLHRFEVAGLVLSAPAIVPRLTRLDALKLRTLSLLAPSLTVDMPYDPTRLTGDPEQRRIALDDTLIHGFKSAELIGWLMRTAERVLRAGHRLEVETLLLVAGDDRVIDIERTREFADRAPQPLVTMRTYEGGQHELLNEVPRLRNRVEDDIVEWLEQRTEGLSAAHPTLSPTGHEQP